MYQRTTHPPKKVLEIAKKLWPNYRGRTVTISTGTKYRDHNYWDEGFREYSAILDFNTGKVLSPGAGTSNPFLSQAHQDHELEHGQVRMAHVFSGTRQYISILVRPDEADRCPLLEGAQ